MLTVNKNNKNNMKYSYEDCYLEAKKYLKLSEFSKFSKPFYNAAYYYKWLNDYTWLEKTPTVKWTEEEVYQTALKFKTLTEFRKTHEKAYRKARDKGWLDLYTWMSGTTKEIKEVEMWCVYEIDEKYVYIGLTMDIKRRDYEHCCHPKKDFLAKFCLNNNITLKRNSFKLIKSGLTAKEAQILEDITKKKYLEENNFIVLNSGSTGEGTGSLGSLYIKWNEKTCYEAAKKCVTKKEFKTKYSRAYKHALKYKWIDSYEWFQNGRSKPIVQYSLSEEFIQFYLKGMPEVISNHPTYKSTTIKSSIRDNSRCKTAYGYIWKRLDSVQDANGNYLLHL